jgi:hypothetical protein
MAAANFRLLPKQGPGRIAKNTKRAPDPGSCNAIRGMRRDVHGACNVVVVAAGEFPAEHFGGFPNSTTPEVGASRGRRIALCNVEKTHAGGGEFVARRS